MNNFKLIALLAVLSSFNAHADTIHQSLSVPADAHNFSILSAQLEDVPTQSHLVSRGSTYTVKSTPETALVVMVQFYTNDNAEPSSERFVFFDLPGQELSDIQKGLIAPASLVNLAVNHQVLDVSLR